MIYLGIIYAVCKQHFKSAGKKVRSRSFFKFIGAEGVLSSIGFKRTDATYRSKALFSARSVDVQFG